VVVAREGEQRSRRDLWRRPRRARACQAPSDQKRTSAQEVSGPKLFSIGGFVAAAVLIVLGVALIVVGVAAEATRRTSSLGSRSSAPTT
jgi:hypothetical protein